MDQDDSGPEYGAGGHTEEQYYQGRVMAPQVPNGPYRPLFDGVHAVRQARAARLQEARDKAEDEGRYRDAPTALEDQHVLIEDLYNAFNSIEQEGENAIIDKPTKTGKLSQAAMKFKTGRYPEAAIQEVCWEIFDRAQIAQQDVKLLEPFHESKFEGTAVHTDFYKRWDAIVGACARSKALCKMLLDAPYLDRFVSHPQGELKMKLNNKKINAQRDEQNEIGRTFLAKGLGKEEAAEAIAHLHPEEEDPYDKYANLSSRNNRSAERTAGVPSTPLAPARRQPARAAATSSAKRKKMSDSEDEDDEDDEYIDSATRSGLKPSLRSRRPTLKTPTRSNMTNSVMNKTPQSKKLKGPSTGPRQRLADHISPQKLDSEVNYETPDKYKSIICKLLKLDPKHPGVDRYSLEDLRDYARPYNGEYQGSKWTHKDYEGCVGKDETFTDADGKTHPHFALVIKSLMPLAKLRGDYVDGVYNKNKNEMFHPKTTSDRQAVGSHANAVGFHAGYPSPVSIKTHGSPSMMAEQASFSNTARHPAAQMNTYPVRRQPYYTGPHAYNSSGSPYMHFSPNNGGQSYSRSPQSYGGSSSGSYSSESFVQGGLSNQQAFENYASSNSNYNSQGGGLFSHGLPAFPSSGNNLYADSVRGQSTGYHAGHGTQNSTFNASRISFGGHHSALPSPQIGHNVTHLSPHTHLSALSPHLHDETQYPDPDECSSQQPQQ